MAISVNRKSISSCYPKMWATRSLYPSRGSRRLRSRCPPIGSFHRDKIVSTKSFARSCVGLGHSHARRSERSITGRRRRLAEEASSLAVPERPRVSKMHEASTHGVHHHAPPTSFIRNRLQHRSQSNWGAVLWPGLVAVLVGTVFMVDANSPRLGKLANPRIAPAFAKRRTRHIMTPESFLQLMTMHATIMVFFVLTVHPLRRSVTSSCLSRWAEDMPFPYINMMSFSVTLSVSLYWSHHFLSRVDLRYPDGRPTHPSALLEK